MGKTQSKRSVDITTEPKKDGLVEEGTGKMEKIEDVDQLKPQVNGDTHHNETESTDKEKPETETTENEKDLSTEKEQKAVVAADSGASGDTASPAAVTDENETLDESKASAAGGASPAPAETSTVSENGESSKKPKKEKVKKKWSFRSISFGKKDKQKPSKKEEATATAATNGECEKVPEEPTEEQTTAANTTNETKPDESVQSAAEEKPANDENTAVTKPTVDEPKEEKSDDVANGDSKIVEADVASNAAAAAATVDTAAAPVEQENISEKIVAAAAEAVVAAIVSQTETVVASEPVTNGTMKIDLAIEKIADETVKLNGSFELSKIEVKSDDIIKNTTTSGDQIIAQNQETIISGDSESIAQNPSPPPLPCTLPPSQVMVFALSDDNNQVESIKKDVIEEKSASDKITAPVAEHIDIASSVLEEQNKLVDSNECTENSIDISLVGSVAKDLLTEIEQEITVAIKAVAESVTLTTEDNRDILNVTPSKNSILDSQAAEITIEPVSSDDSVTNVQITPATPEIPTTEVTPATPDASPVATVEVGIASATTEIPATVENVEPVATSPEIAVAVENVIATVAENVIATVAENVIATVAEDVEIVASTPEVPVAVEDVEVIPTNPEVPAATKDVEVVPTNPKVPVIDVEVPSKIATDVIDIMSEQNIAVDEKDENKIIAANEEITTTTTSTSCNSLPSTVEESQPSTEINSNQDTQTTNNTSSTIQSSLPQNPISPPPPSTTIVDESKVELSSSDVIKTNGDNNVEEEKPIDVEKITKITNEIPVEIDNIKKISTESTENVAKTIDNENDDDLPLPPLPPSPVTCVAENLNDDVEITSQMPPPPLPSSPTSAKKFQLIDDQKIFKESDSTETATGTTTTMTTSTATTATAKPSKENGVGDKHETSATESLNGGVEHKTIEELKSENKIAPEITNESAVAVAE